jgi:uncharacterized protein with NRDE domain
MRFDDRVCTVVVSFEPTARSPLLILAVRDELLERPWLPPARHWPERPGLLGGLDLKSGGTWLAIDPGPRRVSCVLNGVGVPAPDEGRQTRGTLPLLGAAADWLPDDLSHYDPFHLVTADLAEVILTSWDGMHRADVPLPIGLSVIVNSGLDDAEPRAAALRARLSMLTRPDPASDAEPGVAWGGWLSIAAGDGVARDDGTALISRRLVEGHGWYGASSVTMLAVGATQLRYDFAAVPAEPGPLAGMITVE